MSVTQSLEGSSSSPRGLLPYHQQHGIRDKSQSPSHPTLPPMSSLLPKNEQLSHQQYQTLPPPCHPRSGEKPHPLLLSEMNPLAPPHHIFLPPLSVEHSQRYRPEPVLIPIQSQDRASTTNEQDVPSVPRRQIKKIVQRREDLPRAGPHSARHVEHQRDRQSIEKHERPGERPPVKKAMPISDLLSSGPSPAVQPRPVPYRIKVRQQPLSARACGFGERDRRVIDPPPILQMTVDDPNATPEEISSRLKAPWSVVHCTLWNPDTDTDDTAMPGATDKRQNRRLMGTLVASPFVGKDENDQEGCFFPFPDLSVRTPGTYSLKFKLVVIDPLNMGHGSSVPVVATIESDPFTVYNAKDFGGMRPSTELTKRLKHQGCLISVKKGNAKTNEAHPRGEEDEDEEDDYEADNDDGTKASSPRKGKRAKRRED